MQVVPKAMRVSFSQRWTLRQCPSLKAHPRRTSLVHPGVKSPAAPQAAPVSPGSQSNLAAHQMGPGQSKD